MNGHCPYLGLEGDPDTILAYSDQANHCHVVSPPEPVNLTYQASVCLSSEFASCPVFRGKTYSFPELKNLPPEIRGKKNRREAVRLSWGWILVVMAISLIPLALFLTSLKSPNSFLGAQPEQMTTPASEQTPSPEDLIPAINSTCSIFLPLSINDVEESTTPTATASPALEMEMVASPEEDQELKVTSETCTPPEDWVIYTVRAGDSLVGIASRYGITVAEYVIANCLDETAVIVVGQRLYVPIFKPPQPIQITNPPLPVATLPPPPPPTNPPPPPTSIPTAPPPTPIPTQPPLPTSAPPFIQPTLGPTPDPNQLKPTTVLSP
jgi:LysM repeat protein